MPHFHFDVRYDHEPWSNDPDGIDLANIGKARKEAVALMAGLVKDNLRQRSDFGVRVRDGLPTPVRTLTLSMHTEDRA